MTLKNGTHADRTGLQFRDKVVIAEYLRGKLQPAGDGYYGYIEGHSDRSVAEAMPFDCSHSNVAGVRVQMYGKLRNSHPTGGLAARLTTLEKSVDRLYGLFGEIAPSVMDAPPEASALRVAPDSRPQPQG
jgi:hypothetical protein